MTKRFGARTVLDRVDMKVPAGTFHALLGENGAGKSTLVKCIMGSYRADEGGLLIDGKETIVSSPDAALALGIGMVYQHFTLVPSMTVAENMVLARVPVPRVIDWTRERAALEAFLDRMPFRVPLDRRISTLSAGEKQKVEILKLLNLGCRFLILDEPTAVLTPGEADEVLGFLRGMVDAGAVTVLMITHKFREVTRYADAVTVLHRGRLSGSGAVSALTVPEMAAMMLGGEEALAPRAVRQARPVGDIRLEIEDISALRDDGIAALNGLSLSVRAGEILGVAGVSGNGQSELVQVLAGQRPASKGSIRVGGEPFGFTRAEIERHGFRCLTEEPLRNAGVGSMSVASNMALRTFDRPPLATHRLWIKPAAMRAKAADLIEAFGVQPPLPEAPLAALSGGNVQRAILARELSEGVAVLVVANPCFGLDFSATAEIRGRIVATRNAGAAVLLVSEDLDEVCELSDRIVVISGGRIGYQAAADALDMGKVAAAMAGAH